MTRHRKHDQNEVDRDAHWRARDHDRTARPQETGGDYYAAPWRGPAEGARRGAPGSGGRDDRPGEATGPSWESTSPPWELPGPDAAVPARRRARDDSAHPSGPLPQVNSGPQQRLPADSGPPSISGPLAPVPREPWLAGRSRYAAARHGSGFSGQDDTGYRDGPGYSDAGFGSGEYPAHGESYDREPGYGDSFPARGSRGSGRHGRGGYGPPPDDSPGGDYPAGTYDDEPGYAGEEDYPGGHGYSDGAGYSGTDYPEDGYSGQRYAGDDYQGHDGYADEPGYPDREAYSDGGYHDGYGRALRDDPDDHGYGDRGGWYGDVDQDQAWGDDEYDEGVLPGFSEDEGDFRGARGRGLAKDRGARDRGGRRGPPPSRPGGKKPKRKSPMRRAAPWIALTVLAVVLVAAGSGFYYVYSTYLHPPDYSGPGTGTVKVQIKPGETAAEVGQQLAALGVVASARAFSNAAKASGHGSSLQPGYYLLHRHMAAALAFALLLKPSSRVQLKVLITEGMRLSEIIAALGKETGDPKGYEQAIKNVSALGLPAYAKGNPEGYLFPATYTVQPGTQPVQVLRAMVLRFSLEASSVNLPKVAVHDQISEGDAITIASLVQAEGRRPKDLAKIARVIYNRLNLHMRLQVDATVLYARHSRAAVLTNTQIQDTRSPYNTYLHAGLPPGPIDSPGDAAIRAALHPAPPSDNWLYYVTVNPKTGLTKFTSSFTVFQQYEQELANYNATHH